MKANAFVPFMLRRGDGSTLSLDFTAMSGLDSRFTFTRASNATFINSAGLVQYAQSNHAPTTNWNFTNPSGTGWNVATTSGTGTFQWVGDGTIVASSGPSGQAFTQISSPSGIQQNLRYVMSVTVQSVTGSPTIQSIFDSISASSKTYFKNGASATSGTTVAAGDRISVAANADTTGMNVRIGCGAWFANRTNESVTLTQFHWHPGSEPVSYYENTTSSPRYDSARFDHDPTTLAPRGLLLEGSATNLLTYSEDFNAAAWTDTSITRATGNTDPAGGATAVRFTASSGNATVIRAAAIGTTASRTFSIFLRRVTGTGNIDYTLDNGSTYTTQAITGSWVRYTFTATSANHQVGIRIVTSGDAIEMWGAQLEEGSGASSYIPTGAGTVQRATDVCVMDGANFSSWFNATEGTILVGYGTRLNTGSNRSYTFLPASGSANQIFEGSGTALNVYSSSSFVAQIGSSTNSQSRVCGAYRLDDYAVSVNGGAVATDTSGAVPSSLTRLTIGGSAINAAAANNGPISLFKYWPTRLPDATLQALTT